MTSRLLFAAKQTRSDTQIAIVYLCTRVREPIKDDYLKLARIIQYLRVTAHLPLVIGWDDYGTLLWSIDV